jgi:hypothetical protein
VLVQACDGYDLTTSYNMNRNHHLFTDRRDGLELEQETVDFTGAISNAESGKSYQYDGGFTRWSDHNQSWVTITGLELRFEVGTPGQFSVAIDRIELDIKPDPVEAIKAFVPNALRMELCYLLADTSLDSAPQADVTAGYGESSVLIPPAHYLPGDAGPCEPRRGYPHDC